MPMNLVASSRICWTENSTLYSAQETACTHGACANEPNLHAHRTGVPIAHDLRFRNLVFRAFDAVRCATFPWAAEINGQQKRQARRGNPMKIDLKDRTAVITGG